MGTQRRGAAAAAIVLAGGSGTRVGAGRNKVYLPLGGRTVLAWSLETFLACPDIGPVVLVVRAADRASAERMLEQEVGGSGVAVVTGGGSRQASELAGLQHLAEPVRSGAIDTVLVHDGARPLVAPELVAAVLAAARTFGGCVPGIVRDDLAFASADGQGGVDVGVPAPGLVAVQTPQGFLARPLLAAYEEAQQHGFAGTDTASCVQRFAPELRVRFVPGDERNIKITYPEDMVLAERLLGSAGRL